MVVDLSSYIFKIIEYDPTEKPRGIVTADEWNTIMHLLKEAVNYNSHSLQEITSDLYTASQLSSTELGNDGSRLIGIDAIPGIAGNNVNSALRSLKEQMDSVVLGAMPDASITSDKLAPNLNLVGNVTINNQKVLTLGDRTIYLSSSSTNDQVPGAKAVWDLVSLKQDKITYGTSAPNSSTPGNIYLQYV